MIQSAAQLIPFKEPRSLAGLAAKLPAVFLPDEKAVETRHLIGARELRIMKPPPFW